MTSLKQALCLGETQVTHIIHKHVYLVTWTQDSILRETQTIPEYNVE